MLPPRAGRSLRLRRRLRGPRPRLARCRRAPDRVSPRARPASSCSATTSRCSSTSSAGRARVLRRRRLPDERRRPHARELRLLRCDDPEPRSFRFPKAHEDFFRTLRAPSRRGRLPLRPRRPRSRAPRTRATSTTRCARARRGSALGSHERRSPPRARRHDRLRPHARPATSRCAGICPSASASTPAPSTAACSPRSACPTRRSSRSERATGDLRTAFVGGARPAALRPAR